MAVRMFPWFFFCMADGASALPRRHIDDPPFLINPLFLSLLKRQILFRKPNSFTFPERTPRLAPLSNALQPRCVMLAPHLASETSFLLHSCMFLWR